MEINMIQTNDKQVWNKQMVESLSCIVVYETN